MVVPYSGKFSPGKIPAKSSPYQCGKFLPDLFSHTYSTFVTDHCARAVTTTMKKAAKQDQGALHYTVAGPAYSLASKAMTLATFAAAIPVLRCRMSLNQRVKLISRQQNFCRLNLPPSRSTGEMGENLPLACKISRSMVTPQELS